MCRRQRIKRPERQHGDRRAQHLEERVEPRVEPRMEPRLDLAEIRGTTLGFRINSWNHARIRGTTRGFRGTTRAGVA